MALVTDSCPDLQTSSRSKAVAPVHRAVPARNGTTLGDGVGVRIGSTPGYDRGWAQRASRTAIPEALALSSLQAARRAYAYSFKDLDQEIFLLGLIALGRSNHPPRRPTAASPGIPGVLGIAILDGDGALTLR